MSLTSPLESPTRGEQKTKAPKKKCKKNTLLPRRSKREPASQEKQENTLLPRHSLRESAIKGGGNKLLPRLPKRGPASHQETT